MKHYAYDLVNNATEIYGSNLRSLWEAEMAIRTNMDLDIRIIAKSSKLSLTTDCEVGHVIADTHRTAEHNEDSIAAAPEIQMHLCVPCSASKLLCGQLQA